MNDLQTCGAEKYPETSAPRTRKDAPIRGRIRTFTVIKRLGAILLALLSWQLLAMYIDSSIVLCSPVSVLRRLFTLWREPVFASSVWFTLCHVAGGFFLGLATGCVLAAAAGRSSWIRTLLWPWMAAIKAVPVAAIVVICLIWLSGKNLSIFISFLVVCPVVYQNLLTGYQSRSREMDEMAQVFRMKRTRYLRYILIPGLFPYLNAACKVAAPMAWKAGIAAEIIGTPAGSIGKQMYLAKTYLATDDLLAWALVIVLLSALSEKLLLAVLTRIEKSGV